MEGVIYYQNFNWAEEITNSIKVWLSAIVSLVYCYFSTKFAPRGTAIRLCLFFPVICLFLILPLSIHSMHIGGLTSFFIAWLANFKILLLAFGTGPLSDPSLSLPQFVTVGCFPIKVQQDRPSNKITNVPPRPLWWNYGVMGALIGLFLNIYHYSDRVHPKVILVIYCFHIYFALEIVLAAVAALARACLGLELEPQFDEPYRSTSLQDFWGRRWNLMVTRILRASTYDPTLKVFSRIVGRKWAQIMAVLNTFVVSALMHELIFYYLGRTRPTWEITWFFLLHGMSLVVEILVKKALNGRWRLPPVVSTPLTVGFVVVTGFWLFFPQLLRCKTDVKAFEEYAVLIAYVKQLFVGAAGQ